MIEARERVGNFQDIKDSEFSDPPGKEIHLMLYSILSQESNEAHYQVGLAEDCRDFLHYNNTQAVGGFYVNCDGSNYSKLALCKK